MKMILIIVFLNGYGPRPTTVMQEFDHPVACATAAKVMMKGWAKSDDTRSLLALECVPKGEIK